MTCEKYGKVTLFSYVTGDLPSAAMPEVELHLRDCTACTAFVADIRKEQAAFLEAFPAISAAPSPARSRLVRFPPWRTALALAASLILAAGTATLLVNRQTGDGYRTKGAVALKLFVQDSAGVPAERTAPVCVPGERIQFTYSCGNERYFMLMSVDGTGAVSVFYPARGDSSVAIEPGNDLPLPNSIVLDDYIGKEWYVAVFSTRPLHVGTVAGEVRRAFGRHGGDGIAVSGAGNATVKIIRVEKRAGRR